MSVITLGGLSGGGARVLGPLLAERLESDYVDRLILTEVARQVGATVEALHQREERPPSMAERVSRLLHRIMERSAVTGAGGDPYFGPGVAAYMTEEYENLPQPVITRGHELEDKLYIEAVRKVMKGLADTGNCILVGRGAHIILQDVPYAFRVGIVAKLEDRIATIMRRERLTREQAQQTLEARDKARQYYFKRFFKIDFPDQAEFYHMVINMSEVSVEYALDMIVQGASALLSGRVTGQPIAAPSPTT